MHYESIRRNVYCDRQAYWQLVFSRDNAMLADHPITEGRDNRERIQRVMTFVGHSLYGRGLDQKAMKGDFLSRGKCTK